MDPLGLGEIVEATGGRLLGNGHDTTITGISIDSRTIEAGQLFVAIRGERFDGHDFIQEACDKGAMAILTQEVGGEEAEARYGVPVVAVEDTVRGLQDIASLYRLRFDIPVVAITGSCGKTTTKDMLAAVMSGKWRIAKTVGNLNNHIGLPLTLFNLSAACEAAVVEMGASGPGEIWRLCEIARPSVGVITNICPVHLEGFGSVEGVADAKGEMLRFLDEGQPAVLNADDPWSERLRKTFAGRVITFGIEAKADYQACNIEFLPGDRTGFCLNGQQNFVLSILGRHNVYNALAAIAAAEVFGVDSEDVRSGLEQFRPLTLRMEVSRMRRITLINDAYNANPSSMKAAVETLSTINIAGKRFLVAGDMLELGKEADRAHSELGRQVAKSSVDYFITMGKLTRQSAAAAAEAGMPSEKIHQGDSVSEVAQLLLDKLEPGDIVLFKGSRKMKVERVLQLLQEKL